MFCGSDLHIGDETVWLYLRLNENLQKLMPFCSIQAVIGTWYVVRCREKVSILTALISEECHYVIQRE